MEEKLEERRPSTGNGGERLVRGEREEEDKETRRPLYNERRR